MRNKSGSLSCINWSPVSPYFPEPRIREGQILPFGLQCLLKLRYPDDYEFPQLLLSFVFPTPGCAIYHYSYLSTSTFMRTGVLLLSNQKVFTFARHIQWKWVWFLKSSGFHHYLQGCCSEDKDAFILSKESHCGTWTEYPSLGISITSPFFLLFSSSTRILRYSVFIDLR